MATDKRTDTATFLERHPRLNFLLGLLLLLFFVVVCFGTAYVVVQYIVVSIGMAVDWLASLASKLDAVVIVALITGSVSIIGVLISSVIAKRIEYKRSRQEYLAKKREIPY